MIIRNLVLAAATFAALSPTLTHASPETTSVKACARAFATSIAAPGADAPAYRLAFHGAIGGSVADYYATAYTFTMEAHDPKTGSAVARAVCSTNNQGVVTALSAIPLPDKTATFAAGL